MKCDNLTYSFGALAKQLWCLCGCIHFILYKTYINIIWAHTQSRQISQCTFTDYNN